ISVFANHFDHYYLDQDVQHDPNPADDSLLHVTTLKINRDGIAWNAEINYGLDQHENTCAHVQIDYGENSGMVIGDPEPLQPLDSSRQRTLPSDYDALLQQASSIDNFYHRATPNSVKEAIYNEETAMLPLLEREIPDIFL